jgi:hypothetical protein
MIQVTLFTKPDCPLCTQLQEDLAWLHRDLSAQHPFDVTLCDISTDAARHAQFHLFVPVLEIAGALYYPPHDLVQLRRLLVAAGTAQTAK